QQIAACIVGHPGIDRKRAAGARDLAAEGRGRGAGVIEAAGELGCGISTSQYAGAADRQATAGREICATADGERSAAIGHRTSYRPYAIPVAARGGEGAGDFATRTEIDVTAAGDRGIAIDRAGAGKRARSADPYRAASGDGAIHGQRAAIDIRRPSVGVG